jgi:hypothetical protein
LDVRPTILLAIAISIAIVALGCGGGSDQASTTSPPSKAEFVKQANAACERARAGLGKRVSDFERQRAGRKPEPGADMVHFIYLPTMEAQIFMIEELGVPRGEEKWIDALLDAERFGVDAVAVKPRVPSMAAAEREFAKADNLFLAYGLDSCVTDSRKPRDVGSS